MHRSRAKLYSAMYAMSYRPSGWFIWHFRFPRASTNLCKSHSLTHTAQSDPIQAALASVDITHTVINLNKE